MDICSLRPDAVRWTWDRHPPGSPVCLCSTRRRISPAEPAREQDDHDRSLVSDRAHGLTDHPFDPFGGHRVGRLAVECSRLSRSARHRPSARRIRCPAAAQSPIVSPSYSRGRESRLSRPSHRTPKSASTLCCRSPRQTESSRSTRHRLHRVASSWPRSSCGSRSSLRTISRRSAR